MSLWSQKIRINGASCTSAIISGEMLLPTKASEPLNRLIFGMASGKVLLIIKNDDLLLTLGSKLIEKSANSDHHVNYIRGQLRSVARLLISIREGNPDDAILRNASMSTIISPKYFKTVLTAVRDLSGFNEEDFTYTKPSLALKLGHALRKCSLILKGIASQAEDSCMKNRAKEFYNLCGDEWTDEIAGSAHRTLENRHLNQPPLLPLTSDVMKLMSHIKDVHSQSLSIIFEERYDEHFCRSFRSLGESVLCQLILFNRRRQGEVSKVLLNLFNENSKELPVPKYPEVQKTLSPLERFLCHNFRRFEIPGKRNNNVPLLMTNEQMLAISNLTNSVYRHKVGIASSNPYVFAVTSKHIQSKRSVSYIRGHDVLRKFSALSGCENPKSLRSKNLRKHVATMSQILNLRDHELDQLATFMGHDVRVHRQFYRLPEDVVQTAKVTKILMAMENGTIGNFQGKTLDEIDIDLSSCKYITCNF